MLRQMILLLLVLTLALGLPEGSLKPVSTSVSAAPGVGPVDQHAGDAKAAKRGKRSHKRHKKKRNKKKAPSPPPVPTCFGLPATIKVQGTGTVFDTPAADVIIGDADRNTIVMLNGGQDRICTFGGDDIIIGPGNSAIAGVRFDGGAGNDFLTGGGGFDLLIGGPGNDRLEGERGDDDIFGGEGNDRLTGGEGSDVLDGGEGVDTCQHEDAGEEFNC